MFIVYNKYDLNEAIKAANQNYPTTDKLKYTSATWSAYETALNNAKTVLTKREVTQGATDSTDTNTINGAKNAAYLALQIIANKHDIVKEKLVLDREEMKKAVLEANEKIMNENK